MRIVVYADFLSTDHHTVTEAFFKDLVTETARKHPADSFVLLARKSIPGKRSLPANITIHTINFLTRKYPVLQWLNKFRLKRLLRKFRADLFITASRYYADSFSLPCVFLLLEPIGKPPVSKTIPSLAKPNEVWIRGNKQLYAAVKGAATTIVFSQQDAWVLKNEFGIPDHKLSLIPMDCVKETGILQWEEKEHVKNKYTAGAEYFIFAGDIHQRFDLLGLLKAFSLFKKWQQSGMQLVIAGSMTSSTGEFIQKLATFKYRKEVHLITNPSNKILHQLIAAAYAFVYPTSEDHFPLPVISAMRSGVPVITFTNPVINDSAGNNVIYAQPDAESLSSSMQAVYKDEASRSGVIDSAALHITQNYQTGIAESFYGILENTLHSKS